MSFVNLDSNSTPSGGKSTTGARSDSREKTADLDSDVESPEPESPAGIAGFLLVFFV